MSVVHVIYDALHGALESGPGCPDSGTCLLNVLCVWQVQEGPQFESFALRELPANDRELTWSFVMN